MRDNATAESCELLSAGSDGTLRFFNTGYNNNNNNDNSNNNNDNENHNNQKQQCL